MDKETFDKKVAAIWSLYDATLTINSAGLGTRSTSEQTAAALRRGCAELGEALATKVGPEHVKEFVTVIA